MISREHAFRFGFISVSGLLFLGSNAAWNGLGYLNPAAWFLEWSSVVLAFVCVYAAVRTKPLSRHIYGYALISVSLVISAVSYIPSLVASPIHGTINQSIDPYYFIVLAIPLLLMPFLIRHDFRKEENARLFPLLFFLSVIGSMAFLLYMFYRIAPAFPTDESVFDMYAAHLFLAGKNPYDPVLMSNAFSYFHFNLQAFAPITPLTTGGYVNSLTYPALSFLLFIPAVMFKVKAALIMLPMLIAPIIVVWYRAWSRKEWLKSAYAILPFVSLLLYAYQGASADTDALWATLLMLSYFVLPSNKASGIMFGLSLSVKQLPILVAPFFLYFMYREYGLKKTITWIAIAAAAFLAINGYSIILNPGYWLSSMVANEFAPLIGIGYGIPQISFAGIFPIPAIFFTIAMVDILLALLILYMVKYREMKYAMFAFPILIFLFNYRLFPQYLFYWILVSLLPMLDLMHVQKSPERSVSGKNINTSGNIDKGNYWKIAVSVIIAILLVSVPIGYHEGIQKNQGSFKITSVMPTGYNASGYVNSMSVSISYQGSQSQSGVYFRIFSNGPIINGNMFQWVPQHNATLLEGQPYSLTIEPQYPLYSLNATRGFMVVAYYGNVQGNYYFKAK